MALALIEVLGFRDLSEEDGRRSVRADRRREELWPFGVDRPTGSVQIEEEEPSAW